MMKLLKPHVFNRPEELDSDMSKALAMEALKPTVPASGSLQRAASVKGKRPEYHEPVVMGAQALG